MNILLINPPTANAIQSEVPSWVKKETGVFPPLGLLYLAAFARQNTRHDIALFDSVAENNDYGKLRQSIESFRPRVVGITAHTHNLVDVIQTAEMAKRIDSSILVCIGGPHTEVFPRQTARFSEVDFVLTGEAERTFCRLLKAIEYDSGYDEVGGLYFRRGEDVVEIPGQEPVPDLDSLPFPERDRLKQHHYFYALGHKAFFTTLATTRGCPFHCTFCSSGGKKHRARSPENVVDEIETCLGLGIEEIHFIDDTFNVSMERVTRICEEILRRKLKLKWTCRPRGRGFSREIMELLKKAGCVRIQIGVETGSDEGLEKLQKGITIEDAEKTVSFARAAGITSMAYFLIGCPHEKSEKDIRKTLEFSLKLDPTYCLFNILTPYPGTAVFEEGVARGLFEEDVWEKFAVAPAKDFVAPVWDEFLSREDLFRLLELAYKKFYLRPRVVWRDLKQMRSWKPLGRRIKTGLIMLTSGKKRKV